MKVLVTGGAGYVGTVLARRLVELGHGVRVVDIGFFGLDHVDQRVELVAGDILEFDSAWLEGVDAVVHLAGLSNDPMAAFSPRLNYMLNAAGAAIVAEASKRAGVHRFVLGSTCSVYGLDDARPLDEDHPTSPSFPYAISKLMAERMLGCLTDDAFRPIILRKGTVVGWSPRMRFDLVVNTMIKTALLERTITIHNPDLWRPLIDIEDAAMAYVYAVEAPPSVVGVFNISGANFKLDELGSIVAAGLRDRGIEVELRSENRQDVRSYRVETSKAARVLGFTARKPMTQTVTEVIERARAMPRRDLEHRRHYNIRQFEHLMANGSVPALAASVQSGQALAAGRAH